MGLVYRDSFTEAAPLFIALLCTATVLFLSHLTETADTIDLNEEDHIVES